MISVLKNVEFTPGFLVQDKWKGEQIARIPQKCKIKDWAKLLCKSANFHNQDCCNLWLCGLNPKTAG